MNFIHIRKFGSVTACELGWSLVGRPSWTVHLYVVDGFCIDTGQSRMRRHAVDFLKRFRIQRVLLTHHHEDHSGNAAVFQKNFGIPVYGHPACAAKMKQKNRILPYQHYMWGASRPLKVHPLPMTVASDKTILRPIHTPGHSKDHVAYYDAENGRLFSGDLFLAERIKYFRSDENMKEQIDSLKKVNALNFESLFCAHNPKPSGGKRWIAGKLQFLEELYGRIQQLWAKGLDENEIIRAVGLKESRLIKIMCLGNVSLKQMIRSAVRSF